MNIDPRDTPHVLSPNEPRTWTAGKGGLRTAPSLNERLFTQVTVESPTGCWIWQGDTNPSGYGRIRVDNRGVLVHRLVFRLTTGWWPNGESLHSCDVRRCVSPLHVREGSHTENMRDMVSRGRLVSWQSAKTHCPAGHSYDGANLHVSARGDRECRTCRRAQDRSPARRDQQRARRARKKEVPMLF